MTNTRKLKGRIAEMGFTMYEFAAAVGISRPALRKKLFGDSEFKVSEIERICTVLEISYPEMATYFFTGFVSKMDTARG